MNLNEISEQISILNPSAIYLGRVDMEAMEKAARDAGCVPPLNYGEPDLSRHEYMGVPIYRVNSEHHIGYGFPGENAIGQVTPPQDSQLIEK